MAELTGKINMQSVSYRYIPLKGSVENDTREAESLDSRRNSRFKRSSTSSFPLSFHYKQNASRGRQNSLRTKLIDA